VDCRLACSCKQLREIALAHQICGTVATSLLPGTRSQSLKVAENKKFVFADWTASVRRTGYGYKKV